MALAGQDKKNLRLVVPAMDGDEVTLIVRPPTDDEKDAFRRKRTKFKRGNVVTDYSLDVQFINMLLVGCENIQILDNNGFKVDLDPAKHPDWKLRIDRDWKLSAASAFLTPLADIAAGEEVGDGNFLSSGSGSSSNADSPSE